jgi:hypothetical protein
MKIFTFGDGYAAGHIWPEWPQLVELATNTQVINHGFVGAGNEYIFNCAVKSALTASKDDVFLVQWAKPDRFDKLLTPAWAQLQEKDSVYNNNNSKVFDQEWWCSSASRLPEILHYKSFYVEIEQAVNRTVLYMISLSKLLDSLGIQHRYFLTYSHDYSAHTNFEDLRALPWINFGQGMDEWTTTNTQNRGNDIQPSTQSQLSWIVNNLLQYIAHDQSRLDSISDTINSTQFVAFDPDRQQQWQDIKQKYDCFF